MKHFFRTVAGKTILFVGCVIAACVLAACVLAEAFMWSEDGVNFYFQTDDEIQEYYFGDFSDPNDADDRFLAEAISFMYVMRYVIIVAALLSLLLIVCCFVALMTEAGKRPGTDEITGGPLEKIPYDVFLAICAVIVFVLIEIMIEALFIYVPMGIAVIAVCGVCAFCLLLWLCMSTAVRIKLNSLFRYTLIFIVLKLLWKLAKLIWKGIRRLTRFNAEVIRGIPVVWKTVLGFLGISLVELIALFYGESDYGALIVMFFLEKILVFPALVYFAVSLRRLQKGGEALANGDLDHVTGTKGMIFDLRRHGENLNSIAEGMSRAVEERMKSERMKTELITNVSHDIKTPLTSIINYAGLIGNEKSDNPKINEYSEVLVRQSERLKRLIEDLVEASKASTGNLEVKPVPCSASVFLSQAAGEYEEKLRGAGLELITKQPEKELRIMADGRRMWRIFDNLMNNVCKYAKEGTRVYLSLEHEDKDAVFSFKNISRDPLDMSEEELMERFTRGDSSRNTEGNGLGLSIAKSMAELQGGTLRLSVDGDLFKAVLRFPVI